MLQSANDAQGASREGQPVLGWGWKEVEMFDDLEDLDEYESDEEVRRGHTPGDDKILCTPLIAIRGHADTQDVYVVMDLGGGITNKALLAENSYQLVVRRATAHSSVQSGCESRCFNASH